MAVNDESGLSGCYPDGVADVIGRILGFSGFGIKVETFFINALTLQSFWDKSFDEREYFHTCHMVKVRVQKRQFVKTSR